MWLSWTKRNTVCGMGCCEDALTVTNRQEVKEWHTLIAECAMIGCYTQTLSEMFVNYQATINGMRVTICS